VAERWRAAIVGALMAGALLLVAGSGARAQSAEATASVVAADPALDQHVQRLAEELRCLVCQNQTIADSHAQLALDLKAQVREQLARGASDAEVKDYMVQRYGDFVLYRPPVKATTWLLWAGPALMLGIGLGALALKLRRQARDGFDDGVPAGENA